MIAAQLAAFITPEHWRDLGLWAGFFLGFAFFVLRRIAFLIRSKGNTLKNRRTYLVQNYDLLGFRLFLDTIIWFNLFRHADVLAQWLNLPSSVTNSRWAYLIFHFPQRFSMYCLLGFCADSGTDFLFAWVQTKFPRLKEDLPDIAGPNLIEGDTKPQ